MRHMLYRSGLLLEHALSRLALGTVVALALLVMPSQSLLSGDTLDCPSEETTCFATITDVNTPNQNEFTVDLVPGVCCQAGTYIVTIDWSVEYDCGGGCNSSCMVCALMQTWRSLDGGMTFPAYSENYVIEDGDASNCGTTGNITGFETTIDNMQPNSFYKITLSSKAVNETMGCDDARGYSDYATYILPKTGSGFPDCGGEGRESSSAEVATESDKCPK